MNLEELKLLDDVELQEVHQKAVAFMQTLAVIEKRQGARIEITITI